jgi:drug/metabolite transporter (DMT)-like permease
VLTFLTGVVGISFAAIFVRMALPAPPLTTGFYRMLFATLLAGAWLWLRPTRTPVSRRAALLAAASGVCFGTDIGLWHSSLVHTSVALSTLLVNITPILVGLFSVLVWREKLQQSFVAGTLIALLGTFVLLGAPSEADEPWGATLALAASLFYAGYLLLMKLARSDAPALPSFVIMSSTATLTLGSYTWLAGDAFSGFPARSWAAMFAAAVVSQLCGVMGILWALRWLPATLASVALLAQPVGTALLGWLLLDESLTWIQLAGGAAVLSGILLASRSSASPASPGQSRKGRSFHHG